MDPFVFVAVLIAAACHAGWNAILKLNVEPIIATTMVAVASGLVVVPFAFFAGLPDITAWPCLVASVAIHIRHLALWSSLVRRSGPSSPDRAGRRAVTHGRSLRLSSVKCPLDGPA
jgi:hypothetical protein